MKIHVTCKRILRKVAHRLLALAQDEINSSDGRDYRWTDPQNVDEAKKYLINRLLSSAQKNDTSRIILIGGTKECRKHLADELDQRFNVSTCQSYASLLKLQNVNWSKDVLGIASFKADEIHSISSNLLRNNQTNLMTVEYAVVPKEENLGISRMFESSNDFISPLHLEKTKFFELYEESCEIFDPKTGIRDFMDLMQGINHVLERKLLGDLAEFGSFKGQSGYLTARFLEEKSSPKKLFMFDAFESFPTESIGVDRFWSETHEVDFTEIRNKFTQLENVQLIKGDFTETLSKTNCDQICLAFVDCDSYRGTRFLINEIFEKRLVPGGIMIFEDYGHASLLGNRIAIHEGFEDRRNAFCFFSQFSGSFFVCKLSD